MPRRCRNEPLPTSANTNPLCTRKSLVRKLVYKFDIFPLRPPGEEKILCLDLVGGLGTMTCLALKGSYTANRPWGSTPAL